ncbi:MAG: class I SAM-dependent methyltransferase [Actinomycetia bacterium]|nr:class I SAM-dependent methyltransferase [Actinomycetes bacterium]
MKIADIFELVLGDDVDVEVVAYDGSKTGRMGSDVRLEIRSPQAMAAIITSPDQLGVARAFVNGDIEVEGDIFTGMERLGGAQFRSVSLADKARVAKEFAPLLLKRPPIPPEEVRLSGRRHGKSRDAEAISHHYDVSNDFYRLVLGPSMAYTCAVYPNADATLEQAQEEKFDLVCRKLDLQPGMRLLDVGCGWGGMVRHATEHYGVKAIGVTLSEQQAQWGQRVLEEQGLAGQSEVRFGDYRDIPEAGFDRVSSIGLTEHIGKKNYPSYFGFLRSKLREEGRLLNHSITRSDTGDRTLTRRGFINRYIFPDGELTHVGVLVDQMERAQLEVQHEENLRAHYAMTLRDWGQNLTDNWDEAVAEVGLRKARVWRLYLAASRWGFAVNRIQLHQVLSTRTSADGDSGMPLRPTWGS